MRIRKDKRSLKNRDCNEEMYISYKKALFLEKDIKQVLKIKKKFAILDFEAFGIGKNLIKAHEDFNNRIPFYCGLSICEINDGIIERIKTREFYFSSVSSQQDINAKQLLLANKIEKYLVSNNINYIFTYYNEMEVIFFKKFIKKHFSFIDLYDFSKHSLFSLNIKNLIFDIPYKDKNALDGEKIFFKASEVIWNKDLNNEYFKEFLKELKLYNSHENLMMFKFIKGLTKKYLNDKSVKYLIKKIKN